MPSTSSALPPPTKGWDTREKFGRYACGQGHKAGETGFPESDKITVRRGSSDHVTGMTGAG